jgi:hypothetical protein
MSGTVPAGKTLTGDLLGVPPWTPLTPTGGWTNTGAGTPFLQYRLWKQLNSYEVIGCITAGTITDGTTIGTLPATFADQGAMPVIINVTSGGAGGKTPQLECQTSGALQVFSLPAGTTIITFHGWYSLDA